MINNPVLKGFHADPSMICVDGTFYIANSTFEYYPGVKISESKDLANWKTVSYPLKDKKHIDMKGNPKSAGIWAPCLSYSNGIFYLVYTDVKSWDKMPFKDAPNFITTTTDIHGEWSDPVYVNSSGFDASLFTDIDGKKYFVNMEWDYRKPGTETFSGILVTELDSETLTPIGKPVKIFKGTERGCVEGPHIYKKDDYYYLLVAEGGTSYEHAESVARSKNIYGPYEVHPDKHLVTCWGDKKSYLQKTGHGSICCGSDGRWWLAFLCGRPTNQHMRCPLGRETGVAEIVWKNNWPYLKDGGTVPPAQFEGYGEKVRKDIFEYGFDSEDFKSDFQTLRVPCRHEINDDGSLRIYGGESLASIHEQSMYVRRQDAFSFVAETAIDFKPDNFQQMAGMIYRYSEENQYYFRISYNENIDKRTIGLLKFDKYNFSMTKEQDEIVVDNDELIYLRLTITNGLGHFSSSFDGKKYIDFPDVINSEMVCDEYETPMGFTGAFVGMSCQDLQYKKIHADFKYFKYMRYDND